MFDFAPVVAEMSRLVAGVGDERRQLMSKHVRSVGSGRRPTSSHELGPVGGVEGQSVDEPSCGVGVGRPSGAALEIGEPASTESCALRERFLRQPGQSPVASQQIP